MEKGGKLIRRFTFALVTIVKPFIMLIMPEYRTY